MATLYTPAPQREGLDWLGGMVRDAQQLWQNQAKIAQQAKHLELQRQQQKMQEEHFWVEQARLKGQEDFQNRKFLYGMKQDETTNAMREKEYGLTEQRVGFEGRRVTTAEEEARRAADPNSPENRYRVAATRNMEASAEQTSAETDYSFGKKVPQPFVTGWELGETGTPSDYQNARGGFLVPDYSLALSPDMAALVQQHGILSPKQTLDQKKDPEKLNVYLEDGTVLERQWDDVTRSDLRGRFDLYGDAQGKRNPHAVKGTKVIGFSRPGEDMIPVGGQRVGGADTGGQPAIPPGTRMAAMTLGKGGKPTSMTLVPDRPERQYTDPLDTKADKLQDNLRAAHNSMRALPDYPATPVGKKAPSDEALRAYNDKVAEVKAFNARAQADVAQITKEFQNVQAQQRMRARKEDLVLPDVSPEFEQTVGREYAAAFKSQNPAAMRALRPKVEALAQKGDKTAMAALTEIDDILGTNRTPAAAAPPPKAGREAFTLPGK